MSELSRREITRFRIIEPNLYGAGLSSPLFVRVIQVPNYRSPNYQRNTVVPLHASVRQLAAVDEFR